MSKIQISGMIYPLYYFTKDEAEKENDQEYIADYKFAESVCQELNIECPIIAFSQCIRQISEKNGEISIKLGMSYDKEDIPELENSIVIICDKFDKEVRTLTLFHELRHLWQHKQQGYKTRIHAQDTKESAYDEEEIDADAFAIWYFSSKTKCSIEAVAEKFCIFEKENYPDAYKKRIDAAYQFKKKNQNIYHIIKNKILGFLKRLSVR